MGLITKIENIEEYKTSLDAFDLVKIDTLDRELNPKGEMVLLGKTWFLVEPFNMKSSIEFSKFQAEYREILKANPEITFEEMLKGDNSIVKRIIGFLGIEIDSSEISWKQFKYLIWIISKQYTFTGMDDSESINAITPFWLV
jgi:hypothetical protein